MENINYWIDKEMPKRPMCTYTIGHDKYETMVVIVKHFAVNDHLPLLYRSKLIVQCIHLGSQWKAAWLYFLISSSPPYDLLCC